MGVIHTAYKQKTNTGFKLKIYAETDNGSGAPDGNEDVHVVTFGASNNMWQTGASANEIKLTDGSGNDYYEWTAPETLFVKKIEFLVTYSAVDYVFAYAGATDGPPTWADWIKVYSGQKLQIAFVHTLTE